MWLLMHRLPIWEAAYLSMATCNSEHLLLWLSNYGSHLNWLLNFSADSIMVFVKCHPPLLSALSGDSLSFNDRSIIVSFSHLNCNISLQWKLVKLFSHDTVLEQSKRNIVCLYKLCSPGHRQACNISFL